MHMLAIRFIFAYGQFFARQVRLLETERPWIGLRATMDIRSRNDVDRIGFLQEHQTVFELVESGLRTS